MLLHRLRSQGLRDDQAVKEKTVDQQDHAVNQALTSALPQKGASMPLSCVLLAISVCSISISKLSAVHAATHRELIHGWNRCNSFIHTAAAAMEDSDAKSVGSAATGISTLSSRIASLAVYEDRAGFSRPGISEADEDYDDPGSEEEEEVKHLQLLMATTQGVDESCCRWWR